MNIHSIHIDKLVSFRKNTNAQEFSDMFPKNINKHLWNKFDKQCNRDVIEFYILLDEKNKDLFIDYINNHY